MPHSPRPMWHVLPPMSPSRSAFSVTRRTGRGVSRVTAVDGKPRPARAMLGVCPVVLFWPEDLALVRGGPDGRRRFLDVILAQTDQQAVAHMSRYRRVLEQRNCAAASAPPRRRRTRFAAAASPTELAHHGAWLCAGAGAPRRRSGAARRALASRPERPARAASRFGTHRLMSMRLPAPSRPPNRRSSKRSHRRMVEEIARGVTLAGPHRDDIAFDLDGRPARGTASQGQQRSIVLACKLAEVRYLQNTAGVAPVILLDDVLSELDPDRRRRLLALLAQGAQHQVLVTTTEPLTDVADFRRGAPLHRATRCRHARRRASDRTAPFRHHRPSTAGTGSSSPGSRGAPAASAGRCRRRWTCRDLPCRASRSWRSRDRHRQHRSGASTPDGRPTSHRCAESTRRSGSRAPDPLQGDVIPRFAQANFRRRGPA